MRNSPPNNFFSQHKPNNCITYNLKNNKKNKKHRNNQTHPDSNNKSKVVNRKYLKRKEKKGGISKG